MSSNFLPAISRQALQHAQLSDAQCYDLLVQPLHEELYRRQSFDFMDGLSEGQQLLLSHDYVQQQVLQGGFIQLIQNGYIGLLPSMPGWLYNMGDADMAKVIDDALKVYVLNREILDKPTSVEEFALLYQELKEFEELDARFERLNTNTIHLMIEYAKSHLIEFVAIKD